MKKLKKVLIVLLGIPGALLLSGGLIIRAFVSKYDNSFIETIKTYSDTLYGTSNEVDMILTILKLDEYMPWVIMTGIVWLIVVAIVWERNGRDEKENNNL